VFAASAASCPLRWPAHVRHNSERVGASGTWNSGNRPPMKVRPAAPRAGRECVGDLGVRRRQPDINRAPADRRVENLADPCPRAARRIASAGTTVAAAPTQRRWSSAVAGDFCSRDQGFASGPHVAESDQGDVDTDVSASRIVQITVDLVATDELAEVPSTCRSLLGDSIVCRRGTDVQAHSPASTCGTKQAVRKQQQGLQPPGRRRRPRVTFGSPRHQERGLAVTYSGSPLPPALEGERMLGGALGDEARPAHGLPRDDPPCRGRPCHRGQPRPSRAEGVPPGPRPCHYGQGAHAPVDVIDGPTSCERRDSDN